MSWMLSLHVPASEVAADLVAEKVAEYVEQTNPSQDVLEAVKKAAEIAVMLVGSGTVGSPDNRHDFAISMSGHANPDHEPAQGWANDFVSVSVYQTT